MSLDSETQRQIDDVRAGRSTTLRLPGNLTELPEETRELTTLRSLSLRRCHIERLPSWLEELPNLEGIDITSATLSTFPSSLPMIRWTVDAEQILRFSGQLEPRNVSEISISPKTPRQAIQHVFDLGQSSSLELLALSVSTPINYNGDPGEQKTKWPFFDVIDTQLDEFLSACPVLHRLFLYGCPIGRIPETDPPTTRSYPRGPCRRMACYYFIFLLILSFACPFERVSLQEPFWLA